MVDIYDQPATPCAQCGAPIEPIEMAWVVRMAFCCSEACARTLQARG